MRKNVFVLFFIYLFFIIGCGSKQDSYFPMKEGSEFKYKFTKLTSDSSSMRKGSNGKEESTIIYNYLPIKELKGKNVIPRKSVFNEKFVSYSYFSKEKDGYAFYAFHKSDKEPEIHPELLYFVKFPIEPGTSWDLPSKILVSRDGFPIVLKMKIESIKDTVQVPAGIFKDCLRIKAEGSKDVDITWGGRITFKKELTEWYAPGVGLVKEIIREECSNVDIGSYTINIELIEYKK